MVDDFEDPETIARVQRMADGILRAISNQPIGDVQMALANIVTHLALVQGSDTCDRFFLETIDQIFQIYREASNTKLRNEDKAVS